MTGLNASVRKREGGSKGKLRIGKEDGNKKIG